MAKQIVLQYDGKDYTLEFNRRVARRMEESGFVVDTEKPVSLITDLFRGAFQMHHRRITPEEIEKIWAAQSHKDDLLAALVQMYTETVSSLMDEEETENENPTWKLL